MNTGMEAIHKRMLTTLERKTDPAHTALIVVDVQNDFCAKEGGLDRHGRDISLIQAMVPRLVSFIEQARQVGLHIIYTRSVHISSDGNYVSDVYFEQMSRRTKGRYAEHPFCLEGSWGADFYEGIKPLPHEIVVTKHRFSIFMDTDLDLILRSRGIRTLLITGVTTSVCVETAARDGLCHDYYIVLLKDCVAEQSAELHNNSLKIIDLYFGEVVESADVLRCWEKRAAWK
ncbi:MAG: cysteine hydrolase [Chloroflexi bacterium]|nr:cysteine hydrolase [Chloroflexota bacterium]